MSKGMSQICNKAWFFVCLQRLASLQKAERNHMKFGASDFPFKAPANKLQQTSIQRLFSEHGQAQVTPVCGMKQGCHKRLQQLQNTAFCYKALNIQGQSRDNYKGLSGAWLHALSVLLLVTLTGGCKRNRATIFWAGPFVCPQVTVPLLRLPAKPNHRWWDQSEERVRAGKMQL